MSNLRDQFGVMRLDRLAACSLQLAGLGGASAARGTLHAARSMEPGGRHGR